MRRIFLSEDIRKKNGCETYFVSLTPFERNLLVLCGDAVAYGEEVQHNGLQMLNVVLPLEVAGRLRELAALLEAPCGGDFPGDVHDLTQAEINQTTEPEN